MLKIKHLIHVPIFISLSYHILFSFTLCSLYNATSNALESWEKKQIVNTIETPDEFITYKTSDLINIASVIKKDDPFKAECLRNIDLITQQGTSQRKIACVEGTTLVILGFGTILTTLVTTHYANILAEYDQKNDDSAARIIIGNMFQTMFIGAGIGVAGARKIHHQCILNYDYLNNLHQLKDILKGSVSNLIELNGE